jgi:hypothetical protein
VGVRRQALLGRPRTPHFGREQAVATNQCNVATRLPLPLLPPRPCFTRSSNTERDSNRVILVEEPGLRCGEAGGGGGLEQTEMAINYRSRFAYRIDAWDADGENVIEHLALKRRKLPSKVTPLKAARTPFTCLASAPANVSSLRRSRAHRGPCRTSNNAESSRCKIQMTGKAAMHNRAIAQNPAGPKRP